jgi:hypothetical protein
MGLCQSIYVITNTVNNKKYVGCGNRNVRHKSHLSNLRSHRHSNKPLQEDFDRYGENAFVFEYLREGDFDDERALMIELKTYDERFGYNSVDPGMQKIRRLNGFSTKPSPLKGKKRVKKRCSSAQKRIADYINEMGIKQSVISKKTGITQCALCAMLMQNRVMLADEYMKICIAIGKEPNDFMVVKEGT